MGRKGKKKGGGGGEGDGGPSQQPQGQQQQQQGRPQTVPEGAPRPQEQAVRSQTAPGQSAGQRPPPGPPPVAAGAAASLQGAWGQRQAQQPAGDQGVAQATEQMGGMHIEQRGQGQQMGRGRSAGRDQDGQRGGGRGGSAARGIGRGQGPGRQEQYQRPPQEQQRQEQHQPQPQQQQPQGQWKSPQQQQQPPQGQPSPQHQQPPSRQPSQTSSPASSKGPSRAPSTAGDGDTASVKSDASSGTRKALPKPEGLDTKTLDIRIKNLRLTEIPRRKNPLKAGTQGRPIKVETNMLSIIFKKNLKIPVTHYDVKFDPDRPKFLKKLAFAKLRSQNFPRNYPAFDGRVNAYAAGDLPFGNHLTATVKVFDEERQQEREVTVTMNKANSIDISWLHNVKPGLAESDRDQTTMQVIDVIMRSASFDRSIQTGRSFFNQPRNPVDLGGGMELWSGLFQSAVLGWKPYFNADVAFKAFPKPQSVLETMKELCSTFREPCRQLTAQVVEYNRAKIEGYFRTLKVIYQLPGQPTTKRTVGVNGLGRSARETTFPLDNGTTTTVLAYFQGAKRYNIQYPDLPCLWVGPRNKHNMVPAELCTVAPGLVTTKKLDENQTRSMIRETAKDTKTRKARIKEAFQSMGFNEHPTMQEFGISINPQFETVDARVLNPPTLMDQQEIRPAKGVWRANKFRTPLGLEDKSWSILNLSRARDDALYAFVDELRKQAGRNGMNIGAPVTPFKTMRPPGRDIRELQNYLQDHKKGKLKLLFVVIPGQGQDVYPKVKQVAELTVGCLTQCIKDSTLNKFNSMTAGNILLKVNSKLNGVNHTFQPNSKPDCLKVPCILFGGDVTHPSPDATDIPSIAAVAASHDPTAFRYNVVIQLQPPRQEIILHLEEIVYRQIRIFEEKNKCLPQKIIFYRDGVSEGQFPQVMHWELQAMRNACKKLGPTYQPKITFLVVQKRHHIRFFPTDSRNSDDRNGNVQAGTVVDTNITHPSHIDFYLVSHASIQGTARPTKYRCLWDDNDMSEDQIEQLTYYLCHMFSRCTRSVSYPAPTYYAHLAAFRARNLTYGVNINLENLEHEQRNRLTIKDELISNNPMFFV
ncbi:protein argonaute-2 [Diachasma alloeum]|uniref:protein argonaute-2 n=1 Tax=Diachasma alloeum TaxID=454923 RepID=UPI0007384B33|nr:protein argonaute-2 [Diachasma alloeum]XP_015119384.1 protein argonaute-2 [Diachasma alloeum]